MINIIYDFIWHAFKHLHSNYCCDILSVLLNFVHPNFHQFQIEVQRLAPGIVTALILSNTIKILLS